MKKYGSEFLRDIRLEESKEAKANRKRENKFQNYLKKQVMIHRFKHVNFVSKNFDIDSKTYLDQDKLIIDESYIPTPFLVVLCYNSNPVKITLDYGQELIRILGINTSSTLCSRSKKPLEEILDEIEENYEKDFNYRAGKIEILYQKYNDGYFYKIPDNNSHYDDENSEHESEFESEQEENLKELQDKCVDDFEEINIDNVEFHDFENNNQEEIKYDKHNYPGCYSSYDEYLRAKALD